MNSSNRDDFFQTTASLEESDRKLQKSKNKHGNPIKLSSKILAVAADPRNNGCIYVAESAGVVRKVALETGETSAIYKGPTAPLTSLCFSPDGSVLYSGCWDKTIWSWDVATRKLKRKYEGHTDFVKTVITVMIKNQELLVSGGADAEIIVWDASTAERLYVAKGHPRAVQDLAIDPIIAEGEAFLSIFSAGSDRTIRKFRLPPESATPALSDPILEHETSVYKLFFDEDGDLWTASADRTAKCLSRDSEWKANLTLEHPDFVRDVVVHERGGWVVTACRDEEVRVWNRATGELYHTFTGHFEEVTGLLLLGSKVVSVSIDATIRQWSLDPQDLQRAKAEAENPNLVEDKPQQPILSAEEEALLDELMRDD
ncbi:hypothetical protein VTO42DRAFT_8103 [Malbranchea cinnamomea]